MNTMRTNELPQLLAAERCDRDGAPAMVRLESGGGLTLTMCAHHWREQREALAAHGFVATAANHVEYPHLPGALYDCPACDGACHCEPPETGTTVCVYEGVHRYGRSADE